MASQKIIINTNRSQKMCLYQNAVKISSTARHVLPHSTISYQVNTNQANLTEMQQQRRLNVIFPHQKIKISKNKRFFEMLQ